MAVIALPINNYLVFIGHCRKSSIFIAVFICLFMFDYLIDRTSMGISNVKEKMLCNRSEKLLSKLPDNHSGLVCQKDAKTVYHLLSYFIVFY